MILADALQEALAQHIPSATTNFRLRFARVGAMTEALFQEVVASDWS